MRIILAAALSLIAVSVTGCDINTTPKTTQVGCNCTVPPAPPAATPYPPPAPADFHRHARGGSHHGYARWSGGGHTYYWRREYAEMSVFTYDYHSGSHSYSTGGHGGGYSGASAYAYAAAGASGGGGAYAGGGSGYVGDAVHGDDGYRAVPGATAGDPAHYDTRGHGGARMDPWHGYDVDCPDPANHH